MSATLLKRAVVSAAIALVVIAGWTVSSGSPASAIVGSTTTVSAGPNSFQQATPSGGPSLYDTPYERCSHGQDHAISGPNPILREPLTTSFTSNVPLTLFVQGSGTQWWASRTLTFTNRSGTPLNVAGTSLEHAPTQQVAIVGGTGAYAGARGQVTITTGQTSSTERLTFRR